MGTNILLSPAPVRLNTLKDEGAATNLEGMAKKLLFEEHNENISPNTLGTSTPSKIQYSKGKLGTDPAQRDYHDDSLVGPHSVETMKSPMTPALLVKQEPAINDTMNSPEPLRIANHVQVICVVRPLSEKEAAQSLATCIRVTGARSVCFTPPEPETRKAPTPHRSQAASTPSRLRQLFSSVTPRSREKSSRITSVAAASSGMHCGAPQSFEFDHVCDENATNQEVYAVVGAPVVQAVSNGYNGTMFAYGLTGAGKTHTVGRISPMILNALFDVMDKQAQGKVPLASSPSGRTGVLMSHNVTASFVEVYNETLTDLLAKEPVDSQVVSTPRNGLGVLEESAFKQDRLRSKNSLTYLKEEEEDKKRKKLLLRQDPLIGWYVEGLLEEPVANAAEALRLFERGLSERRTAGTVHNAQSSRSHAIFTLTIKSRIVSANGSGQIRKSKLSLIDLAGSERQPKIIAEDLNDASARCREAAGINKSLSTLQHCIKALSEGASHVPYRDASLTKLLSDALGGNACALMICNVGPSVGTARETLSTFQFSQQARRVQNAPCINEEVLSRDEMADAKNDAMSRMTAELKMLRDEHNAALVKQNAAEQTVKEADARAQKWALVAESACAEASKRAEDATHEARNLVTQLLDAKKEVSRLQECVVKLQSSLDSSEDTLKTEQEAHEAQLVVMKSELNHLQVEWERERLEYVKELEKALYSVKTEKSSVKEEKTKSAELAKHLEMSKNERLRLVDEAEAEHALISELRCRLQASEEEAKTARSEATELRTQVHQQLQQVQEVRDAVRGETSQLSEKLCNSETARETVQGQLAEAEEALRNSANAIEELHDQLDSANNNCEQLQNALAHQKEATASAKATAAEHVSSLAKKYAFLSKFLKQWGKENIRVGESAEFTIQSSHTLDASHEGESDSE